MMSINMPLLDALKVPTYSRYFKDIMGNKREIPPSTVKLTEECSAAIANEAPNGEWSVRVVRRGLCVPCWLGPPCKD